jgi:Trk K+ transport system NAD-binding subunit
VALGSVLLEVVVTPGSPLLAGPLRETALPPDTLLIGRRRDGVVTTPRGDTIFRAGDVVTVVTSQAREAEVRHFFTGE